MLQLDIMLRKVDRFSVARLLLCMPTMLIGQSDKVGLLTRRGEYFTHSSNTKMAATRSHTQKNYKCDVTCCSVQSVICFEGYDLFLASKLLCVFS